MLVLASSGFAQAGVDQVARLGSTDSRTRRAAYQVLRSDKTAATLAALRKALPGYQYHSQTLGLILVQGFGVDRCEPVLRSFLRGKPSILRLGAAVWFHQRRDTSVESHIVACLGGVESQTVLASMLSRIWNIKSRAVLHAVQRSLAADSALQVLDPALRMLQRAKVVDAIPKVETFLKVEGMDADRRALCAGFLVVMGQSRHAAALAEAIPQVKTFSRLSILLRDAGHLDKVVLAAILEFAEASAGYNVRYALELIARHDYRAAVPKLRGMLESVDIKTSKAAFDTLMRMGDGLQPKQLKRLLTGVADNVSLAAADALRRMDDSTGLARVIELTKTSGRIRHEAFDVLGKFRDRRVVPVLLTALMDTDRNVHSRAFRGLQTVFRSLFPYRRFDFITLGYTAAASPVKRRQVTEKIRAWWESQARKK